MRLLQGCSLMLVVVTACGDGGHAGGPAIPSTPPVLDEYSTAINPTVKGPSDPAFQTALQAALTAGTEATVADFLARWLPEDAPEAFPLSYDPLKSDNVVLIAQNLALTDAERQRLAANGFVVSERLAYQSHGAALLDIFQKDLPIFVTADMVLHALHASYDALLAETEQTTLLPTIRAALAATRGALAGFDAPSDAAKDARADCDLILTVALSLLDGAAVPSALGGVDAQVADLLARIEALSLQETPLFGSMRVMDFSQFKPRGHYEDTAELQRYFRAMMWLGRVDLRLMEFDTAQDVWVFHDRQVAGAWLLGAAAAASGATTGLAKADSILRALVGDVDYITLAGISGLSKAHGLDTLAKAASLSAETRQALADELLAGTWGEQKINSHWLSSNPLSAEPTPLPAAFAFFGQRFTVDGHVFSNVVFDRIVKGGEKVPRRLPSPLDALFVLGNSQVLPHLATELETWQYQANLHALRFLTDWYEPDYWQTSAYTLWLSALRGMNAPTTSAFYPEPMRTPAWRDRVINTQLGSWAQLRHDTLLYVKQSYTGSPGCEHPDGWVDPYPELWGALASMADRVTEALAGTPAEARVATFFANWKAHMTTLRAIAEKELDGSPLSEEELAFLKGTAMTSEGCGPILNGWYPSLYWMGEDAVLEWDPTIADVHTNPSDTPPLGPADVLHVATGNPRLMVFTTDSCDGPRAFVGPVFSYYEVLPGKLERYADSDWESMMLQSKAPPPPAWTQSFLVPAP
ncbi:MAG: hypothetical protein AMXMBFR64_27110 [Myxococcales bacterium]